jgi:putative ABC transport system permease protein
MTERMRAGLARYIGLLLSFYPRDFRRTMGPDLELVYLDRFAAEYRRYGSWGVVRYSVLALGHAVRDGLLERLHENRERGPDRWFRNSPWLADTRYAVRGLVKRPAFLIISVVTLGLGIGASTTVFSVVNAVLLRPLPYPNPSELVAIGFRLPDFDRLTQVAWKVAQTFEDQAGSVTHVATIRGSEADIEPDADHPYATRLGAASVSSGLFPALASYPILGRTFTQVEDNTPDARVVILSYEAWTRRWGADSGLVGRSVVVNGEPYEVVGIMPQGFVAPEGLGLAGVEVLFPALVAVVDRPYDNFLRGYFRVVARLAPAQTSDRAQAELRTLHAELEAEHGDQVQTGRAVVTPLRDLTVAGAGQTLWPLFGAVVLLLVIACGNVVNLFMARATSKRREIAVRTALGAGKSDVIRPMALESMLVALLGAGLGMAMAYVGVAALSAWSPGDLPRLAEVALDLRVAAFASALALVTGALVGLAPALRSLTIHQDALREAAGRTTSTRSANRVRAVLVVAQTSIALVLLIGAGLMIHSFSRLMAVDPGFEPEGVLVAHIHLPRALRESQEQGLALRQTLMERLRALPGVISVSTTVGLPLDGFAGKGHMPLTMESAPERQIEVGALNWVGADYFTTMGMQIEPGGRPFTEGDITRYDVLLVNRSFARAFGTTGDIVGEQIKMGPADAPTDYRTVIGVVGDVRGASLASRQGPAIYYPDNAGLSGPPLILVIKSDQDPTALAPAVRAIIGEVAPSAPLGRLETLQHHVARSVTAPRFYTLLLGGFAGAALVLAVVGIYGTLSYMVGQRTREVGVRIALGAAPGTVLRMVVGHGAALGAAGIIIGIAAAAAVSRALGNFLFEVTPLDPRTYLLAAGSLAVAVLLASLAPARRATRVDPIEALRSE